MRITLYKISQQQKLRVKKLKMSWSRCQIQRPHQIHLQLQQQIILQNLLNLPRQRKNLIITRITTHPLMIITVQRQHHRPPEIIILYILRFVR